VAAWQLVHRDIHNSYKSPAPLPATVNHGTEIDRAALSAFSQVAPFVFATCHIRRGSANTTGRLKRFQMSLHSMMTYMAVCDGRVEPQVDICVVVAKIQGQDFPYLSGGFFDESNARLLTSRYI
jgi:hypothetical protein